MHTVQVYSSMSFDKYVHSLEMWSCSNPSPNILPLAVWIAVCREGAMWKRARDCGRLESAYSLLYREGATLADCCHEGPVLSLLWILHEMQEIQKL